LSLLERLAGVRVAIVGDAMLDDYAWGDVARISPDAPVPVVDVRRRTRVLGGAGNVAHNVAVAGGQAVLVTAIGEDAAGENFLALCREAGIDAAGVVRDGERRTTVKTRVVARGQHLLRLDEEDRRALSASAREALRKALAAALSGCDVVAVSDYAKGVVDEELTAEIARLAPGKTIVVDPKAADLTRYRGCTVITPNAQEARAASGCEVDDEGGVRAAAARIQAQSGAQAVLVTRGDRGMALSERDGGFHLIPTRAREVFDVTGAGDTVLAYLTLALGAGAGLLEAAGLANLAAGAKVGKVGTSPVGPAEVQAHAEEAGRAGKVVDLEQAVARVAHLRSLGRRVVFTNGCFDLLHAGHVHLLERARALGDVLVVALNSDASVRRLKGEGRPVVREGDRVRVLAALESVGLVLLFEEDTPLAVIRQLRPDVLVKGGDYAQDTIVGADLVLAWGGEVATVPLVEGRSTTGLLEGLRQEPR
jgi:D-beta-D-heptose 7-phosphate kinase/D-beta-D-heptose 1-phosphate adenosyltransferase